MKVGTLAKALKGTARTLPDSLKSGEGFKVSLRGKTGTTRAPYPTFSRERKRGWINGLTPRKSVHTALMLEVADDSGRARHFVVYLAVSGVADEFKSTSGAAPFFEAKDLGRAILKRLTDRGRRELEGRDAP